MPPPSHNNKNTDSLETWLATTEGARKIPAPITTPTIIAHASNIDNVARGWVDTGLSVTLIVSLGPWQLSL